jgi:prepilin-type processing-associated H-X9-DG protein
MYWEEHGGIAFSERSVRTNGGWRYWFGWLQDGVEGQRDFDPKQGALWPYLQGRGVDVCPSLNPAAPLFKAKARGAANGYAYNLLLGPRGISGKALSTVLRPSNLAVFADGGQVNDFLEPASPEHPMLEEFYYFDTNSMSATVHFRHRFRAQVAFVDGHVGAERPEAGSEDRRVSGQLCGRLNSDRVVP